MKLDRNITNPKRGKYALIKLRKAQQPIFTETEEGGEFISFPASAVDFGDTQDTEFFVIRLKDKYAAPALAAYAGAAMRDDPEYALDVLNLAKLAADFPNPRQPD